MLSILRSCHFVVQRHPSDSLLTSNFFTYEFPPPLSSSVTSQPILSLTSETLHSFIPLLVDGEAKVNEGIRYCFERYQLSINLKVKNHALNRHFLSGHFYSTLMGCSLSFDFILAILIKK
jgi:hypothetical protein